MARRLKKTCMLALPALAAGLLLAEAAVRVLGLAPEIGVVRRGRYRLSDNPLIGYELVPNYRSFRGGEMTDFKGKSNSLGFRDREHAVEKPDGVYRVIVIGDSVAQGFGLEDDDEMFSAVMERELLAAGCNAEVLNFAVSGYNTQQEVETLKAKGLRYDPDMVVVAYCLNDWRQSCGYIMDHLLAEESKHRVSAGIMSRLKFSALARLVYFRFVKPAALTDKYAQLNENTVEKYFDILAGLGKEHSFDVLVVVFPNTYSWNEKGYDPRHKAVCDMAHGKGFATLDLVSLFEKESKENKMFLDIWHPTAHGHKVAGRAIAEAVRRMNKVSVEVVERFRQRQGDELER